MLYWKARTQLTSAPTGAVQHESSVSSSHRDEPDRGARNNFSRAGSSGQWSGVSSNAMTRVFVVALLAFLPLSQVAEATKVDFIVTKSDGTPVLDVTSADIAIKIDGKLRTIRTLRLVSVSEIPPSNTTAAQLPPPFGTNALTSDGRSVVIAIDDDSFRTGREQALREAADGLLAKLSPQDRVLFLTMPYGGVKVPFTTDHARVKRAIATTTGQRPQNETGSEMACRTRRVLEATASFLDLLKFAEGPTSVIFFTGGMARPRWRASRARPRPITSPTSSPSGRTSMAATVSSTSAPRAPTSSSASARRSPSARRARHPRRHPKGRPTRARCCCPRRRSPICRCARPRSPRSAPMGR